MLQGNDKLLGIEIGGTKIQLIVMNCDCALTERIKFEVNKSIGAQGILDQIAVHLQGIKEKHQIVGIGVGFGGPVDIKTGKIIRSYQVKGWDNFELKDWIKGIFDVPTIIDNDTNVAALGEAYKGGGRGYKYVMYITLGSGVGGGFVVDGEIYRGSNSTALEIGHLRIGKKGSTLESRCSGWGLNSILGKYIAEFPESQLGKLQGAEHEDASKLLLRAIALEDSGAKQIFEEFIDDLSLGLSHAIHLLAPELIIVGGGLSGLGKMLVDGLDNVVPKYLMESLQDCKPLIKLSSLQSDVVPIGAGVLIQKKLMY